jgi:hypothetical protein
MERLYVKGEWLLRISGVRMAGYLAVSIAVTGCLQVKTTSQNVAQAVCAPASSFVSSSARLAKALSANVTEATRAACAIVSSYACTHRIFSPEQNDNHTTVQECTPSEGLGDVCTDVDTFTYSTREGIALSNLPASEFEPGGSMNYDEYVCKSSVNQGVPGPTLSNALDLAYASCLDGK